MSQEVQKRLGGRSSLACGNRESIGMEGELWFNHLFGREMNYHVQNLLWGLSAPFGTRRTGNLVLDIIHAASSQLKPQEYEPIECSFRVFRRMLDRERVRTMFIVRAQVFGKLEDLMIEIYRDYQQSRDETSLLFYRDAKLNPVSLIGRGKGYDFIHIVRGAEHDGAANDLAAAPLDRR